MQLYYSNKTLPIVDQLNVNKIKSLAHEFVWKEEISPNAYAQYLVTSVYHMPVR
jgi:hypothetical protein